MILNKTEFIMMNNPFRAIIQKYFEAFILNKMGGTVNGGHALEIGCGRGVGAEIIIEKFGAKTVDAFDLDPRMIELAQKRLKKYNNRVRIWVGDATEIIAKDSVYDAVFDFGIIHHIPDWQNAVSEVFRVLKPGGRFFTEELFRNVINNPFVAKLLYHPQSTQFDDEEFKLSLVKAGFALVNSNKLLNCIGWYVEDKALED